MTEPPAVLCDDETMKDSAKKVIQADCAFERKLMIFSDRAQKEKL